jgi:hypothetical protein
MLKPQDIVILLKLSLEPDRSWSYNQLAYELRMSASEVHKGIGRAEHAGLFSRELRRPHRRALDEFLLHGVKYAFAPDLGPATRGIPTAFSAPVLRNELTSVEGEMDVYVWPYPEGEVRGIGLSPLYKSVPEAVMGHTDLYAALALLDAIRIGRVREKRCAERMLQEMLDHATA